MVKDFIKGLWKENPVFVQVLGMCPTLAVTTSLINGLSMGLATTFVLVASGLAISSLRKLIPDQVRIATFMIVISSFVTVVKLLFEAHIPAISSQLGPYLPLIVTNCIILGRQEAFASKEPVSRSLLDALGMGIGFALALVILGSVRELFYQGTIGGVQVLGSWYKSMIIMVQPAGAFISLSLLVGLFQRISGRK
ncbi:electron transport complex subunit E [Candidatus Bipolaricaulota bacterium]|nr:electron transport complex subunit E [Candidatus Bipolaricaulota bacterium]MBS3814247.1 electron transport complex subunit E [Candidatus Bipolaricaulota bacterium]MBS3825334.1 electron transport complex subunit E [Candidatus Bipolaricaulota bacterium]